MLLPFAGKAQLISIQPTSGSLCAGQPLSISVLPGINPLLGSVLDLNLITLSVSGPAGVSVVVAGNNSLLSVTTGTGLPTGVYNLTISADVLPVLDPLNLIPPLVLEVPLNITGLPSSPSPPATLTALTGSTLSLSGLCPVGTVLGTVTQPLLGVIPVPTTTAGTQSLSLVCNNGGCLSAPTLVNLSILDPVLQIVQGPLACVGEALSLTLLPGNFDLTNPLINVGVSGPANTTISALGPGGVLTVSGLTSGTTTLTVSVSLAGTQILSLPVPVVRLPLPLAPTTPTTVTSLVGLPLSLSGLCEVGSTLGLPGLPLLGSIPVSTSTVGTQSLSLICTNASGCVSPANVLNLSIVAPLLQVLQGPLACVGEALSLTLLPGNFNLSNPLINVGVSGPANTTISALGPDGVLTISGLTSGTTTLTLNLSIAGTQVLSLPVPVVRLPLPLAPTTPTTVTGLVGLPLSLSGLCEVGSTLGVPGLPLLGSVPVPTSTVGTQSLSLICTNASGCISPTNVLNLSIVAPLLQVLQGPLACVGEALSLTLLPGNFNLSNPLINVGVSGPANTTISALGPDGVLTISGLTSGTTTLTLSVSVLGNQVLSLPVPVVRLPLPLAPTTPTTVTGLVGLPLSLSGLCEVGSTLGLPGLPLLGSIPVSTSTVGTQSLSLICTNASGCISPTNIINLSIVAPLVQTLTSVVCLGQPLSLTVLPLNFGLTNPLVQVAVTGPVGATISALGPDGVLTVNGLPTGPSTLTVTVSVLGNPVLTIPVPVNVGSILPPSLPTTLTTVVGSTLSLSGLCPAGTLGTLLNPLQGIIPVSTTAVGVQSLSLICGNGTCVSPTSVINLSVVAPLLQTLTSGIVCLGQPLSVTLLPVNFNLTNPLIQLAVTGPVGATISALGPDGVLTVNGLPAGPSTLTVTASVLGTPLLTIPIPVTIGNLLPPTLPTTLTALAGTPLSLSGLCPAGTLGTLLNPLQGIIPVSTSAVGVQTLSLVCGNGTCLSPTSILNLSVVAPLLQVLQGGLVCVGQNLSLTVLPGNFSLANPLISVGVSGPANTTISALGPNGALTVSGLTSGTTTLTVSVSVAGTQVLSLPLPVIALPVPLAPSLPATLTALVGSTVSLSGLCPTGTLGTLLNPLQGVIPVSTSAVGVQTLSLVCGNGTCLSPTSIVNLSIVAPIVQVLTGTIACINGPLSLTLLPVNFGLTNPLIQLAVTGPVGATISALGPDGVLTVNGLPAGPSTLTLTASVLGNPVLTLPIPVNIGSLLPPSLPGTLTTVVGSTLSLTGLCPAGTLGTLLNPVQGIVPVSTSAIGVQALSLVCGNGTCVSPTTIINLTVVAPLLDIALNNVICLGQTLSLTLLPLNFGLTNPLVQLAITGPVGATVSAVNSAGVATVDGLLSGTQGLTVTASVLGTPVLTLVIPVTVGIGNTILVTASSQTAAAGQSVTLTASGCQSGTLTWSAGSQFAGQPSIVVMPLTTTTYTASCASGQCVATGSVTVSVNEQTSLAITKLVSASRAKVGDLITYTLIVSNGGPGAATNVVVRDSVSSGLAIQTGSINVSTGTFSPGNPVSQWTIPSLPASATVTLVFSASITEEGVVYNTAMIPGAIAKVCTSVPVKVCAGATFEYELSAPSGYSLYQWFFKPVTGAEIKAYEGPLNTFTATAFGEYRIVVNDAPGLCPDLSCCPIVIEADSVPLFTVMAKSPTCIASQPQLNGQLTVLGLGDPASYSVAISAGGSFTTVNPVLTAIPASGVIASNLAGDQQYTVRVYSALGCYRDVRVDVVTNCQCPAEICVPAVIRKTKSRVATLP